MFVIIGGDQKQYEAANADEVRQWVIEGRADANTLIRRAGDTEFKPLHVFPEFNDLIAPPRQDAPPMPEPPAADSLEAVFLRPAEFSITDCLSRAGTLIAANFATLFGAAVIVWCLDLLASPVPFLGILVKGALYGGLYLVYLRKVRGLDASAGNALLGFGPAFMPLAMAGIVTMLICAISSLFILPWIYLIVAWHFTLPLIVDRGLGFWQAMEVSRRISTRVWFKLFFLMLIVFAPFILAQGYMYLKLDELIVAKLNPLFPEGDFTMNAFYVFFDKARPVMTEILKDMTKMNVKVQFVWLANLPFATAVMMFAYEALFGPRKTPRP
jgi:uncharacterized membrane protein